MSLNVLSIGGSRNIGYLTSIRLQDAGSTVTFLLRSPTTFDGDEVIQKYVKEDKARLLKGDALVKEDVQRAWDEAGKVRPVGLLLFTVGGTPSFSLTKGMVITPHNLVTQSLLNALTTLPESTPQPRIITISSIGLTKKSHASLPILFKPMYAYLIAAPHKDKLGAERVLAHLCGWPWNSKDDGEPDEDIMGHNWMNQEGLPDAGSLKSVLVVRPAFLTDGQCIADNPTSETEKKRPYRVSEEELGGYTVSRKDVAHFIADAALNRWPEFENKIVNVGY